jgi:hypothetical protein
VMVSTLESLHLVSSFMDYPPNHTRTKEVSTFTAFNVHLDGSWFISLLGDGCSEYLIWRKLFFLFHGGVCQDSVYKQAVVALCMFSPILPFLIILISLLVLHDIWSWNIFNYILIPWNFEAYIF